MFLGQVHLYFRSIKKAEPEEQLAAHLSHQKLSRIESNRNPSQAKNPSREQFSNALKARAGAANGLVPRRKQN